MRLAVMQPYIFPYLGYYQLVGSVDKFVFFDDVNFIVKGWINRNNILVQDQPYRFTVPLVKASQNRLINEIEISGYPKWRADFLKQIAFNYKKAPYFASFYGWLESFLTKNEFRLIGELAAASVIEIARFLELPCRFEFSSALPYRTGEEKDGQEKVLKICNILGAGVYINPRNGESLGLYDRERFLQENKELHFINMQEITYSQFKKDQFVPNLSIIDVLMFNDTTQVRALLEKYSL